MREHLPEFAALQEALAAAHRPLGLLEAEEEVAALDRLLRGARLPLAVDRDRLARSTEAWVWVRVDGDVARWEHEFRRIADPTQPGGVRHEPAGYRFGPSLAALAGATAVLIWRNCD